MCTLYLSRELLLHIVNLLFWVVFARSPNTIVWVVFRCCVPYHRWVYKFSDASSTQEFQLNDVSLGYGLFPVFCLWFILLLAETNRVPSIYQRRRLNLLRVLQLSTVLSHSQPFLSGVCEYVSVFLSNRSVVFQHLLDHRACRVLLFVFVWTRTTLPRFKIDQLLWLGWSFSYRCLYVCLLFTFIIWLFLMCLVA